MNTLLAQMFLLLVLASGTGWFIGDWWQRRIAMRREAELEDKLKSSLKRLAARSAESPITETDHQELNTALQERADRLEKLQRDNTLELSVKNQEIVLVNESLEQAQLELQEQRMRLRLAKEEATEWQSSYESAQQQRQELEDSQRDESVLGAQHIALREEREEVVGQLETLRGELERQEQSHTEAMEAAQDSFQQEVRVVRDDHAAEMEAVTATHRTQIAEMELAHQNQIAAQGANFAADASEHEASLMGQLGTQDADHQARLRTLEAEHDTHVTQLEAEFASKLEIAQSEHVQTMESMREELTQQQKQLQSEHDAQVTAVAAAHEQKVEKLESALVELEEQIADKERSITALQAQGNDFIAQIETLRIGAQEKDAEVASAQAQASKAEENIERLKDICKKMHRQSDSATKAALAERQKTNAQQSMIDSLQDRLGTSQEISNLLRTEFQKRRSFVAGLRKSLENTQQRLVLTQKAYQELKSKQGQSQQHGLASPIQVAEAEPADTNLVKRLRAKIHQQQLRLNFVGDLVRDLQSMVTSDLAQAVKTRRDMGLDSASAELKTPSDNLQLITGIGWRKEIRLNSLGIRRYRDLAQLGEKDALWLDTVLGLDGEVLREDWVGQSRVLSMSRARRARRARQQRAEQMQRKAAQASSRRQGPAAGQTGGAA